MEPEGAPGGATTAGEERKLKLREARKVKGQLTCAKRRELRKAADDDSERDMDRDVATSHGGCNPLSIAPSILMWLRLHHAQKLCPWKLAKGKRKTVTNDDTEMISSRWSS